MSAVAIALALAILIDPAPSVVRSRAGKPRIGIRSRRRSGAEDPLAGASSLDILAVCLTAGMTVPAAARATASAAAGTLAVVLQRAADLLALGADPVIAWAARADEELDPNCLALLRLARRSASSGTALATAVAELSAQVRQECAHRAEAAAERASVVIAGPLGLCFLPAFICLGVVPVVAGLARDVFGSGLL